MSEANYPTDSGHEMSAAGQVRGEMGGGAFKGRGRIEQVVEELRRQVDARVDFVVDTRDLAIVPGDDGDGNTIPYLAAGTDSALDFIPHDGYPILDQALLQVGGRATEGGVPGRFLRRVWGVNPERTAQFLSGLMRDDPKRRLVRVLDGRVRAFLGQTYRCIDSLDVARCAMERAREHDALPIEASVTESKMRLRFVSRRIVEELQRVGRDSGRGWFAGGLGKQTELSKVAARSWGELPGDTVHPALGFSNSETGHGGCDLDGGILLGACFNLAWVRKMVHEVHIGERLEEGLFTAATAQKHAELVYAKIADASAAYFDADRFREVVASFEDAQSSEIRAPSVACKVAIGASDALNESDLDALLSFFVEQPGERTQFNLGQAVSRLAQEVEPDRASDLEWFAARVSSGEITKEVERAEAKALAALGC